MGMPSTPDAVTVADLSDEDLVDRFRSIKDVNNGQRASTVEPALARAVEREMERRGLMPDREDLIPDESAPAPHLDHAFGETEDIPPGPEAATGDTHEGQ